MRKGHNYSLFFLILFFVITIVQANEIIDEAAKKEREELHVVGMCWKNEMYRCLQKCDNETIHWELFQEICASYCQADVTWACSQLNLQYGGIHIFKSSGRWPFHRIWYFTEFGSVLFCAFSVFMHSYFIFEYTNQTKKDPHSRYPYSWLWIGIHASFIVTFACAISFHTVDIRLTEYLDYFSAMISALFGLYAAIVRIFQIRQSNILSLVSIPFIGFYLFHVARMYLIKFSYGYNMKATMAIVGVHSFLWITWALFNWRERPYVKWIILGNVLLFCFVSLEVFDSPPWFGLFDNHAIWHFTMNIIFYCWNRFYIADFFSRSIPKSD